MATSIDRKKTVQEGAYGRWLRNIPYALVNISSRTPVQAVVAALALAIITYVCFSLHAPVRVPLCAYTALIVALSFSGNPIVSGVVAVAGFLLLDYFFVKPLFSLSITDPFDIVALVLYLFIALSVSTLVGLVKHNTMQLQKANANLEEQIAARKRTEGALQQAEEFARANRVMLMGEMTASIAHEINQPLTGIVANAGTSLRYLAASSPNLDAAREYLELIVRDGRRAADIICRVRELARRAPPVKTAEDLNDVVAPASTQHHSPQPKIFWRRTSRPCPPVLSRTYSCRE